MRAEVKEAIESVVRERLDNARIVKVEVEEDTNWEGDTIYRVSVIYDAAGKLDSDRTASLARYTRSKLGNGDFKVPIFRFISRSDLKSQRAAAA